MVIFNSPRRRQVVKFQFNEIGVTGWCTKCSNDGIMTRVQFNNDCSVNNVVDRLFETDNTALFVKIPEKLCRRCDIKVRDHKKQLSGQGFQIQQGDLTKWNILRKKRVAEYEKDLVENPKIIAEKTLRKQFHLKMNEAQDAWKKGDLKRGDSLSMRAWDILFPTFNASSYFENPLSEEELRIINEGNLAEIKASFLKDPANYELALILMDEALEKNPYYLKHTTYWGRRGRLLDNLGRHTEAIDCYQTYIEILKEREQQWQMKDPENDHTIYFGQGFLEQYFRSLSYSGRENEARSFFGKSQRIKEDVRTRLQMKLQFLE
jgi:tetratricopeptide (TPR) repeat protein